MKTKLILTLLVPHFFWLWQNESTKAFTPYCSNPPFLIFWHSGTLALRTERQSTWMSKNLKGGLDQYGPEYFEV